jgi:excisionase family DNA binding protein
VKDNQIAPLEKAALAVSEFCKVCSIGRTSFYALVQKGEISVLKMGTRTLVPVAEVARFLQRLAG